VIGPQEPPELTGGLGMPGWDSSCWLATCLVTGGTVLLGKCGQVTNDVISGI